MPPTVAGWRAMYSKDPVTGLLYGIGVPPPPSPFIADPVEPAVLPTDFIWGDTSQVVPITGTPPAAPAVLAGQIPGFIYDTATSQWFQILGAPGIQGVAGRGIAVFDQPTQPTDLESLPGDVWFSDV